ncbi:hypothetical protein [Microbacterium sp. USHLN272]|uniref:hypothetical protein n=1 Tax=Microbacterium sp. USHLN272 TaxID=3081287 RepID=UPI0030160570
MPDVELPDAETLAVKFLKPRQPESPVATKVPNPRPSRFTRAWRTGGAASSRVLDQPIITVTCTAADSVTASDDAKRARHAFLNDYTAMPLVRGVEEVTGLYYDPDPDTNEDRYTFAVRLRIRAGRR